ncbi:16S rRNA (guanine(527)-N(7))-methyltransferase RsmG [Suilimivivens sp.]|uniref:16S rRNA (guanine(527)-N(7))-methyltransferase RsmG n=1 Tax=Suilimivivens sp. TaxID=2981669 RepID=UPI00307BA1B2
MKKDFSQLKKDLNEFGIELTAEMEEQFLLYYNMLIEWNSFMNLTAITDFDEVLKKHFTDSVSLIRAIPDLGEKNYRMIDIGTGAGFPGIPLKIVFPNISVVLLDSLNKRVNFLKEVISKLQLTDITAVHGRAEDFAQNKEYRESFDLCVSRAVANLSTLSEYCLPFVKKNGRFISYKSEKVSEEFEISGKAISVLGGEYENQVTFELPDSDIYRNLFIIKKKSATPGKYPRKAGLPSKEPIS